MRQAKFYLTNLFIDWIEKMSYPHTPWQELELARERLGNTAVGRTMLETKGLNRCQEMNPFITEGG